MPIVFADFSLRIGNSSNVSKSIYMRGSGENYGMKNLLEIRALKDEDPVVVGFYELYQSYLDSSETKRIDALGYITRNTLPKEILLDVLVSTGNSHLLLLKVINAPKNGLTFTVLQGDGKIWKLGGGAITRSKLLIKALTLYRNWGQLVEERELDHGIQSKKYNWIKLNFTEEIEGYIPLLSESFGAIPKGKAYGWYRKNKDKIPTSKCGEFIFNMIDASYSTHEGEGFLSYLGDYERGSVIEAIQSDEIRMTGGVGLRHKIKKMQQSPSFLGYVDLDGIVIYYLSIMNESNKEEIIPVFLKRLESGKRKFALVQYELLDGAGSSSLVGLLSSSEVIALVGENINP